MSQNVLHAQSIRDNKWIIFFAFRHCAKANGSMINDYTCNLSPLHHNSHQIIHYTFHFNTKLAYGNGSNDLNSSCDCNWREMAKYSVFLISRQRSIALQICLLIIICVTSSVAVYSTWTVIYQQHLNIPPKLMGNKLLQWFASIGIQSKE